MYHQLNNISPISPFADGLLKARLVSLTNEISQVKVSRQCQSPLNGDHLAALRNLTQNNDIVISRPDKGGGVVILNKLDYIEKINNILNDTSKFKVSQYQKDDSKKLFARLKAILNDAQQRDLLGKEVVNHLLPKGYTIPRLYGLPKVHKPDTPCRPILSMIGSVVHRTAKFLAKILKPVEAFYNSYCFLDSFDMVEKLKRISCHTNDIVFGSFDIVSLFTNVPVKDCFKVIENIIKEGTVSVDIDGDLLLKLLDVCVCDIQFLFNSKYYNQIDGIAMGSPLGPILANIFVGYIEKQIFQTDNKGIAIYGRYVDDILVGATSFDCMNHLADRLNAVHANIKFTVEFEVEGTIPFLDVKIQRNSGGLSHSWYHKDSWSGTFLHYYSYAPMSWKEGLLKGYKYRILRICSQDTINDAIAELTSVFIKNGYPIDFIRNNFIDFVPQKKS